MSTKKQLDTMNLKLGKYMVIGFILGAAFSLLILFVLLFFLRYDKAYYYYLLYCFFLFVFVFGFSKSAANMIYNIDPNKQYSIYEEYDNEDKVQPFKKGLGGASCIVLIALFALSIVNLFYLKDAGGIPRWLSISVLILTFIFILSFISIAKVNFIRII